jgi:signal transduction histidine kinase
MRSGFEHLDGYMTLFTPFDRRLYRQPIVITGKAIAKYLEDLFEARFGRHAITFKTSPAFLKAKITGFPSSFYPVFVNLVDNAIFWLQTIQDRKREIFLDVKGKDFYIIDNGPGVSSRDIENIFELNFSRKPAGRGMGLYISRETLGKIGYGLDLLPNEERQGATFIIHPFAKNNDEV